MLSRSPSVSSAKFAAGPRLKMPLSRMAGSSQRGALTRATSWCVATGIGANGRSGARRQVAPRRTGRRWPRAVGERRRRVTVDRFWEKVDKSDECWIWTASLDRHGYGQFKLSGKMLRAHRVAYELMVGVIPDGLVIDHLCRNRACVRPDHLEPVAPIENVRRGERANLTHCRNGHPYDEVNTYVGKQYRTGTIQRDCRICRRERDRRYRARVKSHG